MADRRLRNAWVRLAGVGILLVLAAVYLWDRPQANDMGRAKGALPDRLDGYSADNFCFNFLKALLEEDAAGALPGRDRLAADRSGFAERTRFYSDQRGEEDFELGFEARILVYRINRERALPDKAEAALAVMNAQIDTCRNRLAQVGIPKKPEPTADELQFWNR